jgi:hypothetical protein
MSSISSFSQDGELVLTFNDFKVIKELHKKTYKILNNKNKVITKDLKYVNYAGYSNSLQALDKNNNVIYFDSDLKKIETPKKGIIEVCGTVAYFKRKIIEDDENYFIEFTEDKSVYREGIKKSIVDTIPKKDIKKIYFANTKKEIDYDENFDFPTYIILMLEDKVAIRQGTTTEYYDSLNLDNPLAIKVQHGKFIGYYGITTVKYQRLENFEYNLARFEDANGNIGYIDLYGNEY